MISEHFKRFLSTINLEKNQIESIEDYMNSHYANETADSIRFEDGRIFYSENYLKLMMSRERQHGRRESINEQAIHIGSQTFKQTDNFTPDSIKK